MFALINRLNAVGRKKNIYRSPYPLVPNYLFIHAHAPAEIAHRLKIATKTSLPDR